MITQKITLTEKGLNAGPLYDVYYSTDCTNFILTQSEVSLPNVGSTANVQVADNTVCVKLINLSPECTLNEVVIDYRVTTTTTAGPTTTTTTTTAAPTTTTTTQDPRFTTTTTYAPGTFARVLAQNCQNSQDSNYFLVPVSPTPALNSVYKDNTGTCYTITGIPAGGGSTVGTLTYVGGAGSCNNAACITTTTTIAPICNTWTVTNPFGAGYYFKYAYCGQSSFLYPEVPANSSMSVCVQNNQIFDAFNTMMTFTSGSTCFATTSTTTIPKVFKRVVAHACQDFYDFNTYGVDVAVTPNPQIGQVFKDAYGTCYYVTSIPTLSGPIVGELTFVGGEGACSSSACVTTTTTEAPFCNQWKVDNPTGAGYYFKYQYCGDSPNFIYPEVPARGSVTVCTQNNRIFNSFGAPLSFTNLNSACFATTTTTTTIPPQRIFTAAPCDDIYDFHVYTANSSSAIILGAVLKDESGTCYQILSFNGQVPVGRLTYVGPPGDCTSPSCVTTTTTEAPFCNLWKVENLSGAGYYFKYLYCGQTDFTYPEVPARSSTIVCVQNNKIFNSFLAPLAFTNLSGSCLGTTTTTTTIGPKRIFTAAPCQNPSNFFVYQADSASYSVGDVFKDGEGVCYSILSFNGQIPVGNLTFVGAAGACTSSACVTTTTTVAPYCNQWQVSNGTGAGYTFKYKYCGQTGFTYPDVPPNSSMIVCVQNDEISNPFGSPLSFVDLNVSCNATTTTTSTTTTTTLAPGCYEYSVFLPSGTTIDFDYVACSSSVSTSIAISANETYNICVDYDKYEKGTPAVVTLIQACNTPPIPTGSCNTWVLSEQSSNLWYGNYLNCYSQSISGAFVDSNDSICAIGTPQRISGGNLIISGTCGTTTSTTTTTTTLAPGCFIYNVTMTGGVFSREVEYVYCGSGSVYTAVPVLPNTTIQLCVQDAQIRKGNPESSFMVITRTTGSCAATTTTTGGPTTTTTTAGPTTTTTSTTTTTLAPVAQQYMRISSCDGAYQDIAFLVTNMNVLPIQNGEVISLSSSFLDNLCWFKSGDASSAIFSGSYTGRYQTCTSCGYNCNFTGSATQWTPATIGDITFWNNYSTYTGSNWGDLSGNNNTASVSNPPLSITAEGIYFTSSVATFSGSLNATPSSSYTLLYVTDGSGSFVKGNANASGSIWLRNQIQYNNIHDFIVSTSGSLNQTYGGFTADNNLHMYTLVVDNVTGSLQLYRDTNIIDSRTSSFMPDFNALTGSLKFESGSIGGNWYGNVSNVMLFKKAISPTDVYNLYQYFINEYPIEPNTPCVYYQVYNNTAGFSTIYYVDCYTNQSSSVYVNSPSTTNICAKKGTVYGNVTSIVVLGDGLCPATTTTTSTTTTTTAGPTTTTSTTTTTNAPMYTYTVQYPPVSKWSWMGSDGLWVYNAGSFSSKCSLPEPVGLDGGNIPIQGAVCGTANWVSGPSECRSVVLANPGTTQVKVNVQYTDCSGATIQVPKTLSAGTNTVLSGVKRGTPITFWNGTYTSRNYPLVSLTDGGQV